MALIEKCIGTYKRRQRREQISRNKKRKKNYDLDLPTDHLIESTRDKTNDTNSNIDNTSLNNFAVKDIDMCMDNREEDDNDEILFTQYEDLIEFSDNNLD